MDFQLKTLSTAQAATDKTDALIVLVPDGAKAAAPSKADALATAIDAVRQAGDLPAKAGKLLALYRPAGVTAPRVLLVGAGDGSAGAVRNAVGAAVQAVKAAAPKRVTLLLPSGMDGLAVRAAVIAAADASYVYTTTKPKVEARSIRQVVLGVADASAVKSAFAEASATVAGIELAKEWGNRPANHCTPTLLAGAAQALGALPRIQCEVLGPKEVAKLGMGSFAAVAQGSSEPLRFIVLRYQGAAKDQAPVVLVGKGITFDTGGVSMKPAAEMDEMKFDMCGAASVLGVFRALGELKPAINVVGLIPAAENMNDGKALKPGDVVTSMSGQTIEVLNTDAEGRLILCDALTYAKRFAPAAVIDIATLTGACVVALGGVRSGLFSSNEALATALSAAGDRAQDLCWRLPLDDEYAEGLKSNFADVANIAGRAGGAITAAKFLQRFAADYPWAHLDIAGTAWKSGSAKGSTGRPVGLLMSYLMARAAEGASAPAAPRKAARKARATP
ncbi:leucyl aminopeptidase [Variovorax arabinosiphilus]|uniref:leucyl aminopeptidase n=1 Tax=Variovorax arabinosiphilus TaxID=3053498 RepID=UPI002575F58C|nr:MULTISPECIES: leucyl aminopeptidase [unclassified Variovorax]MDM0118891.1 leucyl aminopeptidase [Variovorax sp. J2L1-78]MDM0129316.1 leucyl aminopeptidase [Variovorax sp. J2L1-63]MDM0232897.1 leucyl aminopeptidase [Variovorax sp. J2R1-6]